MKRYFCNVSFCLDGVGWQVKIADPSSHDLVYYCWRDGEEHWRHMGWVSLLSGIETDADAECLAELAMEEYFGECGIENDAAWVPGHIASNWLDERSRAVDAVEAAMRRNDGGGGFYMVQSKVREVAATVKDVLGWNWEMETVDRSRNCPESRNWWKIRNVVVPGRQGWIPVLSYGEFKRLVDFLVERGILRLVGITPVEGRVYGNLDKISKLRKLVGRYFGGSAHGGGDGVFAENREEPGELERYRALCNALAPPCLVEEDFRRWAKLAEEAILKDRKADNPSA